jgi:hypothetical protein
MQAMSGNHVPLIYTGQISALEKAASFYTTNRKAKSIGFQNSNLLLMFIARFSKIRVK